MRGERVGVFPTSPNQVASRRQFTATAGSTVRGGHGRPSGALERGRSAMRRVYAVLIGVAVTIVLFRVLTPHHDEASVHVHSDGAHGDGLDAALWALPAAGGGTAVGFALLVASASRAGLDGVARFGFPDFGTQWRALSNGLAWAAIALLGVHFTASAFDVLPGGHHGAGALIGGALGFGTYRLHRHAIEHDAYRTFNLVAMLLAAGSLASMSLTPTGEWWTRNFSTLGTSDDVAAACFNIAIIASGAGMTALSGGLTRALAAEPFRLRRGSLTAMRTLISIIGFGLMGVGLVPIDGDTALHNAFAASAAAAFALLCLGVQLWAARMPRTLIVLSYAALALEVSAMVAYDVLDLFNLTVFEIVAFTLVFAWLISLVAITAGHGQAQEYSHHRAHDRVSPSAQARHHHRRRRAITWSTTEPASGPDSGRPPDRARHRPHDSAGATAHGPGTAGRAGHVSHQRAMWPRGGTSGDPPDSAALVS
jgi:hypothetical protein